MIFRKSLSKLSCVCLSLGKLVNGKHFPAKKKFGLIFRKMFSILDGKHFPEVVKNLEMSYYLLIISNVVLKLLITIYIYIYIYIYCFEYFFFQFHPLEFNFYINFGPHFYNFYLLFPYHFLIEIFYLSNLVLILLIVTYLWNGNYSYFNFFIF